MTALPPLRDSELFRVSSARMAQFAQVFRADADYNPVFAHVPVMQSMVEVVQAMTDISGIHAEHDFVFHAPMRAGQMLTTRTEVTGMRKIAPGLLCRVRSRTVDADGTPVTTQITSVLLRGAPAPDGMPDDDLPERPEAGAGAGEETRSYTVAPEDIAAYSEASRDYAPYTLDVEAAEAMGFPGPVAHGMATLGYAADAVAQAFAGGDGRAIRRLGTRFASPLVVAGPTELCMRLDGGPQTVRFTAETEAGEAVASRGYAVLV